MSFRCTCAVFVKTATEAQMKVDRIDGYHLSSNIRTQQTFLAITDWTIYYGESVYRFTPMASLQPTGCAATLKRSVFGN